MRYADDGVVLCRTAAQARAALDAVGEILAGLGLELHPGKTKVVDLREGREGLDFLGCHFHARMSGRLWEQRRIVRYYLHRWPSQRAMKRLREKVRARTGRNRVGARHPRGDRGLNPLLRGWGNYFRTGNAAGKFRQADDYVVFRLRRLMIKKRGRNLRPGRSGSGTRSGSTGTACTGCAAPSAIRRRRNHVKKIIGKPYAGKPHVRIERGMGKRAAHGTAPLTTNGRLSRLDRPGEPRRAGAAPHPGLPRRREGARHHPGPVRLGVAALPAVLHPAGRRPPRRARLRGTHPADRARAGRTARAAEGPARRTGRGRPG